MWSRKEYSHFHYTGQLVLFSIPELQLSPIKVPVDAMARYKKEDIPIQMMDQWWFVLSCSLSTTGTCTGSRKFLSFFGVACPSCFRCAGRIFRWTTWRTYQKNFYCTSVYSSIVLVPCLLVLYENITHQSLKKTWSWYGCDGAPQSQTQPLSLRRTLDSTSWVLYNSTHC